MKHIFIRTNASGSSGLGHLVRCVCLAKELLSRNVMVILILDYLEEQTKIFLDGVHTIALYDSSQEKLSEKYDVAQVLKLIDGYDVSWVILDDYRLHSHWETRIRENDFKLCVIDDVLRTHQCDLIVDMRWRGQNTPSQYDQLVPPESIKLLGPKYSILSTEYSNHAEQNKSSELFSIMIGDLGCIQQNKNVTDSLISNQDIFNQKIHVYLVLGPFSTPTQEYIDYFRKYKNVELLIGVNNLYPFFCKTDFYIGAAGGVLYQLLALKIPSLTISISSNQQNDIFDLEHIGHFFHLNDWQSERNNDLIQFIKSVIKNYPAFKNLILHAPQCIDGKGTYNITDALLNSKSTIISRHNKKNNVPSANFALSKFHKIRKVENSDINHYLHSRNLPANYQNMIQSTQISALHHYGWWFNTKHESYLLIKNNQPCLYIWHEQKSYNNKKYLIGGWFVCADSVDFQDSLIALNWQLETCNKKFPDIPWIAVIHRRNKFVKLMNDYLGFHEVIIDIEDSDEIKMAIQAIFKNADHKNFHYVTHSNNN